MILLNILLLILGSVVIAKSSNIVIECLVRLSHEFNLKEFSVSFILVSVATSLPELFVGITSAVRGIPRLSLGNVIGANIINLTIVIGIVAVLAKQVRFTSKTVQKDLLQLVFVLFVPILLMLDHKFFALFGIVTFEGLSRFDGFLMLAIYFIYFREIISQNHKFIRHMSHMPKKGLLKQILLLSGALAMVIISADLIVKNASAISIYLEIPQLIIGLFVISFGTTLPELTINTKAVLSHHEEIVIGDLIGTIFNNTLLVLGVTSLIRPIEAPFVLFFSSAFFMVMIAFIFLTFAESDRKLTWKEGIALIMLYIFFSIIELNIKSFISS